MIVLQALGVIWTVTVVALLVALVWTFTFEWRSRRRDVRRARAAWRRVVTDEPPAGLVSRSQRTVADELARQRHQRDAL